MPERFRRLLHSPAVERAQEAILGRSAALGPDDGAPEALGADELAFIARRDSFYLATVGASGWPYVQHRGGPCGVLQVRSPVELAFADLSGNRQLISVGNLTDNQRVSLILVDYPARERLKILGRASWISTADRPELLEGLVVAKGRRVNSLVTIRVEAFDWNCPQQITPRYTGEEVDQAVAPLQQRIRELEVEVERLRSRAAASGD